MASGKTRPSLSSADRIALVAFGGIVVSFAVWVVFAWVEAVVLQSGDLVGQIFAPDPSPALLRLSSIVLVLIGTLLVQMLYTRRLRAEQKLQLEEARVQQMYEHSPEAMLALTPERRVLYANPQAEVLGGRDPGEYVGGHCYQTVWQRDEPCDECPMADVLDSREVRKRLYRDMGGSDPRWLEQVVYPVFDPQGGVESVVESFRDITELRRVEEALRTSHRELEHRVEQRTADLVEVNERLEAEAAERERTAAALRDSEERYRRLVESSPDMVLVHQDGLIAFLNSSGVELLGLSSPEDALGMPVDSLWVPNGSGVAGPELTELIRLGEPMKPTHVKLRRVDGDLVDVELSVGRLVYEGEPAVQCVVRDVTERIRAQETIQRMAYFDPLTDLPNRALFQDRLHSALARARRHHEIVSVIFVDLDDFKVINDSLGHAIGDGVLKAIGERLRVLLREEDTVARQSGDEFTIIARLAERKDAELLAERILATFTEGVIVEGYELHVSASIGIATYPHDGEHEAELVKHADAAMYRAKDWGHNAYRLYSPEMSESAADRLEIEAGLRQALERKEFELYYQPQVDMRDGGLVGVEALLRWNHPEQGVLSPGAFLELAEQAGFMGEIGHWVLETACEQARRWTEAGLDFGRVAVNLSAREFVQQDIVENVARALAETGLDPERLELEITETVAMYNVEQILAILHLLRDMGVRVAIDDFGTGYSSMSYLKRFPIQTLKIAQDFMRDVHVDTQSAAIATMLIELCKELDLDIVAEGVEHASQLEFLRDHGCFVIQGYLFSAPVPVDKMDQIMREGMLAAK